MSIPFVEDVVVIRRRMRVQSDGTYEQLVVWSSTKDEDAVLAMLEKSKWRIGHRDWIYEPDMKIEGLPEPEETEAEE